MFARNNITAWVAEFFGTFVLASVVLSLFQHEANIFSVAVAAGAVLAACVVLFRTVGMLNPAVTVALWTVRKLQTAEALALVVVQVLAGGAALYLNSWLTNTAMHSVVETKMDWRVFTAEALGAFVFAMMLAAVAVRVVDAARAAVYAGVALAAAMWVASVASFGFINPAVAVTANAINVTYMVAPIVGAVVGTSLYTWIFNAKPARVRAARVTASAKKKPAARKKR